MTFSFIAEPPVPDSYLFLPKLSLVEGVAYLRRWRRQKSLVYEKQSGHFVYPPTTRVSQKSGGF